VSGERVRVRLDIAYEGTEFSGWVVQPGRRTVQGELQAGLATVLRLPSVALMVAGRTDAGVHAVGQVAHADLPAQQWADVRTRLLHKLAGVLPADVQVSQIREAPADFDARFSALWRRYEYRISDSDVGADPLRRRQVLSTRRHLDDAAMAEAARALLGLHDFVGFCKWRAGGTTIRSLQEFSVARVGGEIVCTVQADAFCHSMVRSLVGALIAVGDGHRSVDWPASLLDLQRRCADIGVAPAHGLTLMAVGYPSADQFAARSAQTRVRREL
jgi:tRNA pseudouridine38-40 synthase